MGKQGRQGKQEIPLFPFHLMSPLFPLSKLSKTDSCAIIKRIFTNIHMTNRLQTLGALAFALIAVSVSATAIYTTLTPHEEEHALIPTLEDGSLLYGQVVTGGVPIREFSPEEAQEG